MSELERPWSHAVVVTATHGGKYLGWVDTREKPNEYIEACFKEEEPVVLRDARLFVSQIQQTRDKHTGQIVTGNAIFLMPIDAFPHACPVLRIRPDGWYFPADHEECLGVFKALLESSLKIEKLNDDMRKADKAGITLATSSTPLPPPPGGR